MDKKQTSAGVAGAILAGGKASRLGAVAKGLLHVAPGLTIIEKEARELRAAGIEEIVVVANDAEPYLRLGFRVIQDVKREIGPLGGIAAALGYYADRFDGTLFLPCDLPYITAREIGMLKAAFTRGEARVVVAQTAGFFRSRYVRSCITVFLPR